MNTETTFTLKASTHAAGSGTRFERQIQALCEMRASVWHNGVRYVCISDELFTEFTADVDVNLRHVGEYPPFLAAALAVDPHGNRGVVIGARLEGLTYRHTHQNVRSNDGAGDSHYWWIPRDNQEDLVLECIMDGKPGRLYINPRQTYSLLLDLVQPVVYTEFSTEEPVDDFSVLLGKFAEMKTKW